VRVLYYDASIIPRDNIESLDRGYGLSCSRPSEDRKFGKEIFENKACVDGCVDLDGPVLMGCELNSFESKPTGSAASVHAIVMPR
jgi:hypothetical protein